MQTRIFLCNTHFLKNIATKTNEILQLNKIESISIEELDIRKEKKKLFQFCATLLQNSISIAEFDEHLRKIFIIFCLTQYDNRTVEAINDIKINVAERNLDIFKVHNLTSLKESKPEKQEGAKKHADIYIGNDDFFDKIKVNSEYTKYYESLIKEFSQLQSVNPIIFNKMYQPELFNIIINKIHIMPLWTAVMLKQGQDILRAQKKLSTDSEFYTKTR
jgi:hypothetical protein